MKTKLFLVSLIGGLVMLACPMGTALGQNGGVESFEDVTVDRPAEPDEPIPRQPDRAPQPRPEYAKPEIKTVDFTLSLSALFFQEDDAEMVGIGEVAGELTFDVEFTLRFIPKVGRYFSLGLGAGGIIADDEDPTEAVFVSIDGTSVLEAESQVVGASLHGFGRFEYPFLKVLAANAVVGYKALYLSRELVIDDDDDDIEVDSDDLEVDGGLYVGGGFALGRRLKLRVQYLHYLSGDLDYQISIGLGLAF
jgi:hypothetical protein